MADNSSPGLEGLGGETTSAALPLANHLCAFLAGGDSVSVALENFLRDPSDDGCRVLGSLELLDELLFELFDERHVRFVLADNIRPLCGGGR